MAAFIPGSRILVGEFPLSAHIKDIFNNLKSGKIPLTGIGLGLISGRFENNIPIGLFQLRDRNKNLIGEVIFIK